MAHVKLVYRNHSAGMFSMVKSVLNACMDARDAGDEPHVFVANSPYIEDGYMLNGWTRFWEPIGSLDQVFHTELNIAYHPRFPWNAVNPELVPAASDAWSRWVRPNAEVASTVRSYAPLVRRVAVHLRATDKPSEVLPVALSKYAVAVRLAMRSLGVSEYFLASDSNPACLALATLVPGAVISPSLRSSDWHCGYGTHFTIPDRFIAGRDAIADMYTLASARILVCTGSNMSEVTQYVNPNVHLMFLRASNAS